METSSHAQAVDTQHWNPRLWAILIVLCGALFLDGLDVSMVGVALPDIRTALGLSTSSLQWVVSGYVLGYGGLLLLGGRAADLLGRRRVFLVALGLFAAASLLGGVVSGAPLLIAARFVKGMAAAVTAPAGFWPRLQKLMPAKPSAGSKYAAIAWRRPGSVRVSLSRPAARRMASPPLKELICPVWEYPGGPAHEYPL